jgi:hypothetical protein
MAKKKKIEEVVAPVNDQVVEAKARAAAELEAAKGDDYTAVVVIGVREDGSLSMRTNVGSFEFTQYLFNRSSFELFIKQREHEAQAAVKEV